MGEGLQDPEVNPVIIPYSLGLYVLITKIQPLAAAHSSSATSARVSTDSAGSAGSADAFSELGEHMQGKPSCRTGSLARRSEGLGGVRRQYVVADRRCLGWWFGAVRGGTTGILR